MNEAEYLPHLKGSIPKDVTGGQASFYPIQLEAWRRGLKIKFYNSRRGGRVPSLAISYSISDGENEYFFNSASGSKTTKEATRIAKNKKLSNNYLKEGGVPVPETKTFNFEEYSIEELYAYGDKIGFPLVVKPTSMASGRGVVTNIKSREKLKKAILDVRDGLNQKEVIIEKYFENGVDFRFYVIEDEVIAVTKNYPSNIIGDGYHNIRQLINRRNRKMRKLYSTNNRKMIVDEEMLEFLYEDNLTLESVPEKNERIFLRQHGTHLGTRLNAACTNTVDPKFKKYAVDAINVIPGLPTGSVDMIINEEKNEGIVNEVNSRGEIMTHIFPLEGQAIDIPKYLIDYYFPNSEKINDNFYFEYKPIKDSFLTGYADEITLPMYPRGKQYQRTFKITGENFTPFVLRKIKKKAANLYLKGNIKALSQEVLEIQVIGSKLKIEAFEIFIGKPLTSKSEIYEVKSTQSKEFRGVNSIGIEIIDKTLKSNNNNKDDKLKKLEEKVEKLTNELNTAKKQNKKEEERLTGEHSLELSKLKKSKSWKITQPLRNFKRMISKLK